MDVAVLIATKQHDLHRERCTVCGKVFLTVVDSSYWALPVTKRQSVVCPMCKVKRLVKAFRRPRSAS